MQMCSTQWYCFLQCSTEAIFYEAMVLPVRTIPLFLFCEHHVSTLFVCELHPLHHPLHSCPCPPIFLCSFFFLCSIPVPCLPPISGECSIVVLSLVVIWLSCYYTMMNVMIALPAYCWCNYCIICMYVLHGTVVSVHLVYSTVVPCLVSHYRIVCMYTLHGTVVSVHLV